MHLPRQSRHKPVFVRVARSPLLRLSIAFSPAILRSLVRPASPERFAFTRSFPRAGTVQQLEVISGHPLLVQAALDAVKQWKYRPTTLNGEPVEVDTTIDVIFSLNGQ